MAYLYFKHHYRTLFWILFLLSGCSSNKFLTPEPIPLVVNDEEEMEERNLDTMVVSAQKKSDVSIPLYPYRKTPERTFDLLHTILDLRFDWETETVLGMAQLHLRPFLYAENKLILDAKDLKIQEMRVDGALHSEYQNDGMHLVIQLSRSYSRQEVLKLEIKYSATPTKGSDGSAAITSDQGLFFINSMREDPNKPQQIWTQGETEFNSRWFPTIDKPNERCTGEIYLTVDDRFTTLSNGLLKSRKSNPDGTRTDHWVMDKPHAPYLFMIAIGEYAVVKDQWKDIEVSYLVEPAFAEDARNIFSHTTEMLTFFSDLTGIEYPWSKYSQVVVRDYVSGAMENTTAVVFGEFVQKHRRELIDNHNEGIVAHEMIHHWFGDYVTCESWSNLALNEGFANYGEYLWFEHKYGVDEAEHHRMDELDGYLYESSSKIHPLIDFHYEDKEDMFDAHSYNKGGLVLHLLRKIVGEEAFFEALSLYLKKNAWGSVEVHDLRLAFEAVTGQDLNWFFNQWFLSSGHPVLDVESLWNSDSKTWNIIVRQTQPEDQPIFEIPTEVEFYFLDGRTSREATLLKQRVDTLVFKFSEKPVLSVLDPNRAIPGIIEEDWDMDYIELLYHRNQNLMVRYDVLSLASEDPDRWEDLMESALQDNHWSIREMALESIDWETQVNADSLLARLSEDIHSSVRARAIDWMGKLGSDRKDLVLNKINKEEAYPVVASAIVALQQLDEGILWTLLDSLTEERQSDIVAAISSVYGSGADTSRLSYFRNHVHTIQGLPALDFYQNLESLLSKTGSHTKMKWMDILEGVSLNKSGDPYSKIAATRSMISLLKAAARVNLLDASQTALLQSKIDRILANETNPQILEIYQNFLGS